MRNFVRTIALAAALVVPFSVASAQGDSFKVGSKLLSVGVIGGNSEYGSVGVGAAYEVGVKELAPEWTLGVGGFVGFTSHSSNYFLDSYSVRTIPIAAIGNAHYKMKDNPKLDLYGGLSVGFTNYSCSSSVNGLNFDAFCPSSGLGIGGQIGARYDLTPKLNGFLQLGGGSNTAIYFLGLTFKM